MATYDTASDIVAKAMRGLDRTPAGHLGLDIEKVSAFLRGSFDAAIARRLAEGLELDGNALACYPKPWPTVQLPECVDQIELPFGNDSVNAWLLRSGENQLVIDTGLGTRDLALRLDGPINILITHPHPDHVGGIDGLRERTLRLVSPIGIRGAEIIGPGERFSLGGFEIESLNLGGHHPDALGYRIRLDGHDLIAVGDAVFAGSIGGCSGPPAYDRARRTIVRALSNLPQKTILLPGHGPATTIGTELERNPFLARWLGASTSRP